MSRSSKARRGDRRQEATSTSTTTDGGALNGAPPMYTLREVARNLGVSRDTIRRMTEAGRIPFMRVGKQLRYDILAVRAALAPHT